MYNQPGYNQPGYNQPSWLQWFLLLIIVAGIGLHFVYLDRKIARFDEVFTRLHTTGHNEQSEANVALYTGEPVPAKLMLRFLHHEPNKSLIDTLKTLIRTETTKTPLFYAIAWLWTRLLGDDLAMYRLLSAFFGLLSLPALYWFSRELNFIPTGGLLAVALMAVSPMLIRQSQDARMYSLWLLITIISSATLLRALRNDQRSTWALYALTVTFSLYIHPICVVVLVAHAIYVVLRERNLRSPRLHHYVLASVAGGLPFTPWAYLMATHLHTAVATSRYLSESFSMEFTVREWGLNIVRLLVAGPQTYDTWLALLAIGVVAMMLAAAVALWRKTTQATWLLLFLILLLSIGAFVIPDVLFGGQRSVRDRYFMPAYMAATLILAFWLAEIARRKSGQIVMVAILLCALFSSIYSVQATTWWERAPVDADVASLVNQGQNALIISDTVFGVMAMLADDLDEDVDLLLTKEPDEITLPEVQGPIFVYQPSTELLAHIQSWPGVSLDLIYQNDRWDMQTFYLYQLRR